MKKKLIIAAAIAFAVFAIPYGSSALSTVSVASENNTVVTPTPAPSTKPVEEVKNAVDAIDASKITDAASADNAAVALIKIGSQDLKEAMNAGQDTVNDVAAIEAAYKKAKGIKDTTLANSGAVKAVGIVGAAFVAPDTTLSVEAPAATPEITSSTYAVTSTPVYVEISLKAGTYSVKVVPVNAEGTEIDGANTASNLVVKSYNREGFAHFKYDGVGAYNNDGTLKAGAKVLYITAKTAKTVSTTVNTGKSETITGLQSIIDAYSKGKDKTPIAFRIIGKVSLSDLDHISSSAEGLQVKGATMNMTFEGVGDDATVYGFGFLLREAVSVEFRNFAIMRCLDDAMSLDTKNSNVWIHNMDLFYGKKGSAADQAKGDGTVDIKGDSKYVTVAYNRFWDNGKASMCGMKSETGENWITYHHNWFDHSDSRMARVRTMSVHMYNNYYQH